MFKKTEIIAIIDRSGSMASIQKDAEGGFNTFVAQQKAIEGEARLTLVQFDNTVEVPYTARRVQDVEPYVLQPRGSTALYDAIGQTLHTQAKRIHDEKWADLVILVIVTDGHENSSREYSATRVKEMIQHAEKNGWQVLFLAANQDAFLTGGAIGTQSYNTATFAATAQGARSTMGAASVKAALLRAGASADAIDTTTLYSDVVAYSEKVGVLTPKSLQELTAEMKQKLASASGSGI